jgi:hypothetical protein
MGPSVWAIEMKFCADAIEMDWTTRHSTLSLLLKVPHSLQLKVHHMGRKRRDDQSKRAGELEEDQDYGDRAHDGGAGGLSKVDAVRKALAYDPDMKPVEGVKYIKKEFNIDITTSNFSAYKSQIRARQQRGLEGNGGRRWGRGGEPTASDLVAVKKAIAEQDDSLSNFADVVERIESLANQVGGLESLKRCLKTLQELAD